MPQGGKNCGADQVSKAGGDDQREPKQDFKHHQAEARVAAVLRPEKVVGISGYHGKAEKYEERCAVESH